MHNNVFSSASEGANFVYYEYHLLQIGGKFSYIIGERERVYTFIYNTHFIINENLLKGGS